MAAVKYRYISLSKIELLPLFIQLLGLIGLLLSLALGSVLSPIKYNLEME